MELTDDNQYLWSVTQCVTKWPEDSVTSSLVSTGQYLVTPISASFVVVTADLITLRLLVRSVQQWGVCDSSSWKLSRKSMHISLRLGNLK